eukprot:3741328-Amphidinium_carterae.1
MSALFHMCAYSEGNSKVVPLNWSCNISTAWSALWELALIQAAGSPGGAAELSAVAVEASHQH